MRINYPLGGLDLETNKVYQKNGKATIAENVTLDDSRVLKKRFGFDVHSVESDFLKFIVWFDDFNNEERLLGLKSDSLWIYFSGSWFTVPLNVFGTPSTVNMFSTSTEVLASKGCLYFSSHDNTFPIMKFDGDTLHSAGVKPFFSSGVTFSAVATPPTYFAIIYEKLDNRENVILSDIWKFGSTNSGRDGITFDTTFSFPWENWPSIAEPSYQAIPSATGPYSIRIYVSDNPNYGFKLARIQNIISPTDKATIASGLSLTGADITSAFSFGEDLSEIYNITTVKRFPPKARSISSFNALTCLGNLIYYDYNLNTNVVTLIDDQYSVTWSDSSFGGSIESFPALNAYSFSDSAGEITGVFGTDDVLIASKRDKIFFISGNLTNGNYIVRDSISEGIGCVSGNSFMKVDSGAIFMSERGLYWTVQGSKPVEFSSEVSPILRSGIYDLTKSSSDLDTQRELIYISLPHKTDPALDLVLVYSFKWKEWFTYTGYQVKASLTVFNDKIIHTDGVNVYEENTSFNDNGVAIPAKWSTSWLGNSEAPHTTILPYNFSIISLGETAWDCTFSTDSNFSELYPTTEISLEFDAPNKIICQDGDLDKQAVYSFRINLKNDILNEDFRIDSLSINAEPRQMMEKGDE